MLLPGDSAEDDDSLLELLSLSAITTASLDSDRGGTITFSSTVGVFSSRSIFKTSDGDYRVVSGVQLDIK